MTHTIRWALLALTFMASVAVSAQKALPAKTDRLVNDFARLLSAGEAQQLEQKLVTYARETSTEIAVVTMASLEGEDDFDYSYRLAVAWGIGGKENNNGILIFVAQAERKVRIQTGMGAEGFLPDALANRVIEEIISPAFKKNNYYQGLDNATSAIIELSAGEYTNDAAKKPAKKSISNASAAMLFLVIVLVIFVAARIFGGRRKDDDDDDDGGYYRGGRYDRSPQQGQRQRGGGGWIFIPGFGGFGGGGGGGFGGGGSDGGGFGGFGGGDFGGGGAGGDW